MKVLEKLDDKSVEMASANDRVDKITSSNSGTRRASRDAISWASFLNAIYSSDIIGILNKECLKLKSLRTRKSSINLYICRSLIHNNR